MYFVNYNRYKRFIVSSYTHLHIFKKQLNFRYFRTSICMDTSCALLSFSMSETVSELFLALWEVWKEMASAFFGMVPTALHFILWVISGIIILPCVFIAGNLYPKWMEWGEDF